MRMCTCAVLVCIISLANLGYLSHFIEIPSKNTSVCTSLVPGPSDWGKGGGGEKAWYPLHAHTS